MARNRLMDEMKSLPFTKSLNCFSIVLGKALNCKMVPNLSLSDPFDFMYSAETFEGAILFVSLLMVEVNNNEIN